MIHKSRRVSCKQLQRLVQTVIEKFGSLTNSVSYDWAAASSSSKIRQSFASPLCAGERDEARRETCRSSRESHRSGNWRVTDA